MRRILVITSVFALTLATLAALAAALFGSEAVAVAAKDYGYRAMIENRLGRVAPDRPLVVWMGDSTIASNPGNSSWPHRVAERLGDGVENAVLMLLGADPFHHYFVMGRALQERPDVVVLVVNLRFFKRRPGSRLDLSSYIPTAELARALTLPIEERDLTIPEMLLFRILRCQSGRTLWYFGHGLRRQVRAATSWSALEPDPEPLPNVPDWVGAEDRDAMVRLALSDFATPIDAGNAVARMLGAAVDLAARGGAAPLVVVSAVPWQMQPETGWYDAAAFARHIAALREIVERSGGELLDLHQLPGEDVFRDPLGHFLPAGNEAMAVRVEPQVRRLLPDSPRSMRPGLDAPRIRAQAASAVLAEPATQRRIDTRMAQERKVTEAAKQLAPYRLLRMQVQRERTVHGDEPVPERIPSPPLTARPRHVQVVYVARQPDVSECAARVVKLAVAPVRLDEVAETEIANAVGTQVAQPHERARPGRSPEQAIGVVAEALQGRPLVRRAQAGQPRHPALPAVPRLPGMVDGTARHQAAHAVADENDLRIARLAREELCETGAVGRDPQARVVAEIGDLGVQMPSRPRAEARVLRTPPALLVHAEPVDEDDESPRSAFPLPGADEAHGQRIGAARFLVEVPEHPVEGTLHVQQGGRLWSAASEAAADRGDVAHAGEAEPDSAVDAALQHISAQPCDGIAGGVHLLHQRRDLAAEVARELDRGGEVAKRSRGAGLGQDGGPHPFPPGCERTAPGGAAWAALRSASKSARRAPTRSCRSGRASQSALRPQKSPPL
jgi:hypothetical protein